MRAVAVNYARGETQTPRSRDMGASRMQDVDVQELIGWAASLAVVFCVLDVVALFLRWLNRRLDHLPTEASAPSHKLCSESATRNVIA